MRLLAPVLAASLVLIMLPAASSGPSDAGKERVQERVYDEAGRLVVERGIMKDSGLGFERHYWLVPSENAKKPDNPGGGKGGGGSGGGSDPGTDCPSDKYVLAGWKWSGPFSAQASSQASVFATAAQTWEDAAGIDIIGTISAGSGGVAGVQDFHNQIDFAYLGAGGTIAVTTTWYYTSTGQAVESDAQYNTYYAWATDGRAGAMDVQAIATHEIGHTLGLDHPNGNPRQISCLTMYAYGDLGSTIERTLGDGDILGIRALYG